MDINPAFFFKLVHAYALMFEQAKSCGTPLTQTHYEQTLNTILPLTKVLTFLYCN